MLQKEIKELNIIGNIIILFITMCVCIIVYAYYQSFNGDASYTILLIVDIIDIYLLVCVFSEIERTKDEIESSIIKL